MKGVDLRGRKRYNHLLIHNMIVDIGKLADKALLKLTVTKNDLECQLTIKNLQEFNNVHFALVTILTNLIFNDKVRMQTDTEKMKYIELDILKTAFDNAILKIKAEREKTSQKTK